MDWSEFIPSLAKAPYTIYKNRIAIQGWWVKMLAAIDAGRTDIVILGRPSVGKTILSKCLHGQAPKFSFKTPGPSPNVETEAIRFGDWTKLVRVLPGQTDNKLRNRGLSEALQSNPDLEGIIYVVDWGYTDLRDSVIKKSFIVDKKIDTIKKVRAIYLKQEIDDIKNLVELIKIAYSKGMGPKWLLIVVNKVDLFYDRIDDAQRYYGLTYKSKFTDIIKAMMIKIGELNIKCQTLPMCVWQEDFVWNGEIKKTNLGGKEIESSLAMNLISTISKLSKPDNS